MKGENWEAHSESETYFLYHKTEEQGAEYSMRGKLSFQYPNEGGVGTGRGEKRRHFRGNETEEVGHQDLPRKISRSQGRRI